MIVAEPFCTFQRTKTEWSFLYALMCYVRQTSTRLISSSCMLMSASETAERMQRLAREDCYRKHFNKHHNNCWLVCTSRLPNRFSALLFTFFSCTAFLCTPARYSETGFEGDNLSGKNLVKWKSGLLSPSTLLQQRLRMELFFTFTLLPACQVIFHL